MKTIREGEAGSLLNVRAATHASGATEGHPSVGETVQAFFLTAIPGYDLQNGMRPVFAAVRESAGSLAAGLRDPVGLLRHPRTPERIMQAALGTMEATVGRTGARMGITAGLALECAAQLVGQEARLERLVGPPDRVLEVLAVTGATLETATRFWAGLGLSFLPGAMATSCVAPATTALAVYDEADYANTASATYLFGGYSGLRLAPGQCVEVRTPAETHDRPLAQLVLKHRQALKRVDGWDPEAGYSTVRFRLTGGPEEGFPVKVRGVYRDSGPFAGKYAEPRVAGNPEAELFYKIRQRGYVDQAGTRVDGTHGIEAVQLCGAGDSDVFLHELKPIWQAATPDAVHTAVFAPGTRFGDPGTGDGASSYFGPRFGMFDGAVRLGTGSGSGSGALPEGSRVVGGQLRQALPPNQVVTSVQVAVGDLHRDGTSGWSALAVGLRREATGVTRWFFEDRGIPPAGILAEGAPLDLAPTQAGDELVVRCTRDTCHVLGVRVGAQNPVR